MTGQPTSQQESELRAAIVEEAKRWLSTPFHHHARVKGAGVDCLHLLAEVYGAAGLIGPVAIPHYPSDWHLHQGAERFLEGLMRHAREIAAPDPGDIALFRFGRCFSHGAIVVLWPRLIHANFLAKSVTWGDAAQAPLAGRPARFFTLIGA